MTENKDDLISREALKKAIMYKDNVNSETWEQLYDSVLAEIDNAPTVEAKTTEDCIIAYGDGYETARQLFARPQGKWIITQDEKFYHYKCPFCGFWATGDFLRTNDNLDLPNFCEKCGAQMKTRTDVD